MMTRRNVLMAKKRKGTSLIGGCLLVTNIFSVCVRRFDLAPLLGSKYEMYHLKG